MRPFAGPMSHLATCLGLLVCGVSCYFALLLVGTEDRFVLPYAVLSAVLAAVFIIHLLQIKSPVVSSPSEIVPFLLCGLIVVSLSLFTDCIAGTIDSPKSLFSLSCLESSGGGFVSLLLGWVWLATAVAALARIAFLRLFQFKD